MPMPTSANSSEVDNLSVSNVIRNLQQLDPLVAQEVLKNANLIEHNKRSAIEASISQNQKQLAIQEKQLQFEHESNKRSQWMAFGLCSGAILGGVVCIMYGHDWSGTVIAGAGVGLIAASHFTKMAKKFISPKQMAEQDNPT